MNPPGYLPPVSASLKPDWPAAAARISRWWGPERFGPLVQITCPRRGTQAFRKPKWAQDEDAAWWLMRRYAALDAGEDAPVEDFLESIDAGLSRQRFIGDAQPAFFVNFGPGVLAAFLTGFLSFKTSTSWFELSRSMDWDAIMALRLDPDAKWWARAKELTRAAARHARGKYLVSMTDLGGALDVLASLRTTEQLLEDCLTDPGKVLAAEIHLMGFWRACYRELTQIIALEGQVGTAAWMGIWCPRRWYPSQCDFSAMLSPAMFEKLVIPSLKVQRDAVEHIIYHWDGPGQIPHLDLILQMEEIDGIQWVPGASAPPAHDERWLPLYRKIQKGGKRLVLNNSLFPQQAPALLKKLDPAGLLISTGCGTEEEAEALAGALGIPSVFPRQA